MGLFERFINIVKSNINYSDNWKISDNSSFIDIDNIDNNETQEEYDFNKADFEDANDIPEENSADKKYYEILELPYGADFQEVKKAYRKLLKKYHPDLFQNNPEKQKTAQKVTEEINEAYTYFERKLL
jgi:DnaJ-domain-containing protein 1